MVPLKSDHNKRLITVTVKILSDFYSENVTGFLFVRFCPERSLRFQLVLEIVHSKLWKEINPILSSNFLLTN